MTANGTHLDAEDLFNELAESYEVSYGENEGLIKALEGFKQQCGKGASVLDIGCGPGGPAADLAKSGYKVTGIDISEKMIDYCKKNIPGDFHKVDMTTYEPQKPFDGITSIFSFFQLSYRNTYSMMYKMASWLRPGGTLVFGIMAAEDCCDDKTLRAMTGDYVEDFETEFMGKMILVTFITMKGWLKMFQQAGLTILSVKQNTFVAKTHGETQRHLFITAQRSTLEPLYGPHPLPATRRTPHLLSETAWEPFASRLTRHEFDAVLNAVKGNKNVIDVGSGHGELPVSIAKMLGKASAIEPNADRNALLTNRSQNSKVEIKPGSAEKIPYGDNEFDALVALWILHYVTDLEKALAEMARVVDPAAPNSRIVIVQGAPDNEVVNLINRACGPIAEESMAGSAVDHQGLLLATAARVFTYYGFGDISLTRVHAHCNFAEDDLSTRCEKAAEVLTGFWYKDHKDQRRMEENFKPILKEHFKDSPLRVGDQAIIMVAKPS